MFLIKIRWNIPHPDNFYIILCSTTYHMFFIYISDTPVKNLLTAEPNLSYTNIWNNFIVIVCIECIVSVTWLSELIKRVSREISYSPPLHHNTPLLYNKAIFFIIWSFNLWYLVDIYILDILVPTCPQMAGALAKVLQESRSCSSLCEKRRQKNSFQITTIFI